MFLHQPPVWFSTQPCRPCNHAKQSKLYKNVPGIVRRLHFGHWHLQITNNHIWLAPLPLVLVDFDLHRFAVVPTNRYKRSPIHTINHRHRLASFPVFLGTAIRLRMPPRPFVRTIHPFLDNHWSVHYILHTNDNSLPTDSRKNLGVGQNKHPNLQHNQPLALRYRRLQPGLNCRHNPPKPTTQRPNIFEL